PGEQLQARIDRLGPRVDIGVDVERPVARGRFLAERLVELQSRSGVVRHHRHPPGVQCAQRIGPVPDHQIGVDPHPGAAQRGRVELTDDLQVGLCRRADGQIPGDPGALRLVLTAGREHGRRGEYRRDRADAPAPGAQGRPQPAVSAATAARPSGRVATPSGTAVRATASATAGATGGSSAEGTMWSGASSSPSRSTRASAAASFMASVIRVAPPSSAPRKMPGNASTLLIWFGKSLRPVATTEAYLCATVGCTSGLGLDSAKITGLGAMVPRISSGTVPVDSPM